MLMATMLFDLWARRINSSRGAAGWQTGIRVGWHCSHASWPWAAAHRLDALQFVPVSAVTAAEFHVTTRQDDANCSTCLSAAVFVLSLHVPKFESYRGGHNCACLTMQRHRFKKDNMECASIRFGVRDMRCMELTTNDKFL